MKSDRQAYVDSSVARFSPRNENQKSFVSSIYNNSITLGMGPPGTGKTGLAIQTLLDLLKKQKLRKIYIVRLIADTCNERLGALPGEKKEKLIPFMGPVLDNLIQIRNHTEIQYLLNKDQLEVIPVSHARGRTFSYCGILVDECQNLSKHMALTLLTRIGSQSKMIFTGDPQQVDITGRLGIHYIKDILEGLEEDNTIQFKLGDIERHHLIEKILMKAKELENNSY